ncbi:MAG: DUF4159 domain-containing protein [Gemmatimonadetes bacterium]|nr:DUF4159 domain-containing protein [Gemmatimonadota bacterium]
MTAWGRRRGWAAVRAIAALGLIVIATAQGRGYGRQREELCPGPIKIPYDGKWAFARVAFEPSSEAEYHDLKWNHDCPRAEMHFAKILKELTLLNPYMEGGAVFTLDDPDLFKYPFAYVSEPGYWTMTPQEVANARAYLLKGGFLVFDDFREYHWENFEEQLHRVLPDAKLVPLDVHNPVYQDAFFRMKSIDFQPPYGDWMPVYYGVYENNDPTRRLMVIANYNNDIGEYWEWSDTDYAPIELNNEAYKLGVNYVMYALTH